MLPAALIALSLLAAQPADQPPSSGPAIQLSDGPASTSTAVADPDPDGDADEGDIPPGAPKDDYGFVAWCYGALSESLSVYEVVIPDLKDIDKLFGTSVQEDEPYSADVAAERVALKRFGAAIDATERASGQSLTLQGAEDIQAGRAIWAAARLQPHRKLADAWLFWGIPKRCETAAKALKARAHAAGPPPAASGPTAIEIAANEPAPTIDPEQAKALESAPPPPPPAPVGPPPRAGAVLINSK